MKSIEGIWTLLQASACDAQGAPLAPPYGNRPMGTIMFEGGRMLAVLCNGDEDLGSASRREYSSYGGTYTFDGRTLETLVDIASDTSRIGGRQVRDVVLDGKRMTLRPPTRAYGGAAQQRELVWEYVAPIPPRPEV